MSVRADILRKEAAELRKLAGTFKSSYLRERLEGVARECEWMADEIERSVRAGRKP